MILTNSVFPSIALAGTVDQFLSLFDPNGNLISRDLWSARWVDPNSNSGSGGSGDNGDNGDGGDGGDGSNGWDGGGGCDWDGSRDIKST